MAVSGWMAECDGAAAAGLEVSFEFEQEAVDAYFRRKRGRAESKEEVRRDGPRDDDPQYLKARAAYMRLLRAGKLHCGVNCPLGAIDRCTYMCW